MNDAAPARLTHLDDAGRARMVDVSAKEVTVRTATASGRVLLSAAAVAALRDGTVPKGDALAVARIAGITGAKRTPDLIPLCHPIGLHGVTIDLTVVDSGGDRRRDGSAHRRLGGRTRAYRHGEGHRPGRGTDRYPGRMERRREDGAMDTPDRMSTVIRALAVTVSNRAAAGIYADKSGPILVDALRAAGCSVVDGPLVIPDGDSVEAALRDSGAAGYDAGVTTGGTGLTPGDQTPEMTQRVLDREIPGIAEALRSAGLAAGIPSPILSRGVAGRAGGALMVN